MLSKPLLALVCCCGCLLAAQAQPVTILPGERRLDSLLMAIEAQTHLQFCFDSADLAPVRTHYGCTQLGVDSLLMQLYQQTGCTFLQTDSLVFASIRYPFQTRGQNSQPNAPPLRAHKNTAVPVHFDASRIVQVGEAGTGQTTQVTLFGYVVDSKTGDALDGATLQVDTLLQTFSTDAYGYFSITLPPGKHALLVNSSGMKPARRLIHLQGSGRLDIGLQEAITSLKKVTVQAEKKQNIQRVQGSVSKLTARTIKQIPVAFGESDALKVLLTLPGVTSAGEAANGFNVRGGSADQNLVLLNGSTIFNPTHLFGFFAAFNADAVKSVELHKGQMPESFGGRLSSVLDVTGIEGSLKKWSGTAGIGPLTSKITLDGPLKKGKTSLLISARSTYSDWILRQVPDAAFKNSSAAFYDVQAGLTHHFDSSNTLYISGYFSRDRFRLNGDTLFGYGNQNLIVRWKKRYNPRWQHLVQAGTDAYGYTLRSQRVTLSAFNISFNLRQWHGKAEITYRPGNRFWWNMGMQTNWYQVEPGTLEPASGASAIIPKTIERQQAHETALFLGSRIHLHSRLSVQAGIRYAVFQRLGPGSIRLFAPGLPRDTLNQTGQKTFGKGSVIQTYHGPEFRLSARWLISEQSSLKLGLANQQQFLHSLTNTVSLSPTENWTLSGPYLKPQRGQIISLGYFHNFRQNQFELSAELYYRNIQHFPDFKSGAELLVNPQIETALINTRGRAWGMEWMIKKTDGRLNGWISYTYARTQLQQQDALAGETINNGKWYSAPFDRPHTASLVSNYRFSHRINLSVNLVYNSGRPVTVPVAAFDAGNVVGLIYSDRNAFRIPHYFRADIAVNIYGNHKVHQRTHNNWSFGVYNLTARPNPYSVYYAVEDRQVKGYQLTVFGTAIPFISYNIKF